MADLDRNTVGKIPFQNNPRGCFLPSEARDVWGSIDPANRRAKNSFDLDFDLYLESFALFLSSSFRAISTGFWTIFYLSLLSFYLPFSGLIVF